MRLKLAREWEIGTLLDGGGFGQVYAAGCSDPGVGPAVVKLVPKAPGTEREMLFVNLDGVTNIVPIIDSGETEDSWALVMPRADKSLRQHMIEQGGSFNLALALPILTDIATALADLNGRVVHRGIKPENILLLNGRWCLADFGISRYAEATTAPDTQKFAWSIPYAAPERWRGERATGATDVYAFGIIAYELLTGTRPFTGTDEADYRQAHLHDIPGTLSDVPTAFSALVAECLYKGAAARPWPQNIVARLTSIAERVPPSGGRARLQQAHMEDVARQGEADRQRSAGRSEAERRKELFRDATAAFRHIEEVLKSAIKEDAPSATWELGGNGSWAIRVNEAELLVSTVDLSLTPRRLDVIAYAAIRVQIPTNRMGVPPALPGRQ